MEKHTANSHVMCGKNDTIGTSGNTTIGWPHFFYQSRPDQPQSGSERGVKL